jgi:hypothetical protein
MAALGLHAIPLDTRPTASSGNALQRHPDTDTEPTLHPTLQSGLSRAMDHLRGNSDFYRLGKSI